jgi:hypothetical protein
MTDLFSIAIEQRDRRIAELEAENMQLKIAAANSLSYFRSHGIASGLHGLGVRRTLRMSLGRAA